MRLVMPEWLTWLELLLWPWVFAFHLFSYSSCALKMESGYIYSVFVRARHGGLAERCLYWHTCCFSNGPAETQWRGFMQLLSASTSTLAASLAWALLIWNHSWQKRVVIPCCWYFLMVNIGLICLYGRACPRRHPGNGHKNETRSVFNRRAQLITENSPQYENAEWYMSHMFFHLQLKQSTCVLS